MKFLSAIAKNLKLLFRSKETALTIILGPLFIILLVSAAFSSSEGNAAIRIGAYATEYTPLVDQIISSMQEKEFRVSIYDERDPCIDDIGSGEIHTCVLFSDEFVVSENVTNQVTFAVDYSRVNLVYQVIDSLSQEFNLQSSAITKTITDDLLERLSFVQQETRAQIALADSIDADHAEISSQLSQGGTTLGNVDFGITFADLREVRGRVQSLSSLVLEMDAEAEEALKEAIETLRVAKNQCDSCSNATIELLDRSMDDLENATERIHEIAAGGPEAVRVVSQIVDEASQAMEQVRNRFQELSQASTDVRSGLASSVERLEGASLKLSMLRGKLRHTDDSLREVLGLQSGAVTSPIVTTIEPVQRDSSQLSFTYPFVLMLVIMLLGLMLSSSLVVMDKTSTAAFRNFTTATRDEFHVLMAFITSFFILLVQVLIIIVASYFFMQAALFSNLLTTLAIIVLAITLFSFIGMIIGYLSGTREAAMMISLTLGTIFLFVSNLVLPIERMNPVVWGLSKFNPYVALSELLKQSLLFDLELSQVPGQIGLLSLSIILLFVIILVVQRGVKSRFFHRQSKDLTTASFAPNARKVKPLVLGNRSVQDLFDLHEVLDGMTRAQFEEVISQRSNPIAQWVQTEMQERSLARKLKTHSKERMIIALDKFLKRRSKHLAKQKVR